MHATQIKMKLDCAHHNGIMIYFRQFLFRECFYSIQNFCRIFQRSIGCLHNLASL